MKNILVTLLKNRKSGKMVPKIIDKDQIDLNSWELIDSHEFKTLEPHEIEKANQLKIENEKLKKDIDLLLSRIKNQ